MSMICWVRPNGFLLRALLGISKPRSNEIRKSESLKAKLLNNQPPHRDVNQFQEVKDAFLDLCGILKWCTWDGIREKTSSPAGSETMLTVRGILSCYWD